jgi:recombination protein RecR
MLAPPVNRLVTELARLPGIGQRTAQRLAFHLLSVPDDEALGLAEAIREVKETVGRCEVCFNLAVESRCRICEDTRRDPELICVVEQPSDVIPLERTHEFSGRYHVLGGATALYILDAVRERAPEVAVTRLASGLPVGADLEYADEVTLGKALRGRRAL